MININDKYPNKSALMLPLLWDCQETNGWISSDNMLDIASKLDKTPIEVYEVVSFYSMFNLKPIGKNHIEICKTLSCKLCGSANITKILEEKIKCKVGNTSEDNNYTLSEVECLGACEKAPIVVLNGDYYYNVDENTIDEILKDIK